MDESNMPLVGGAGHGQSVQVAKGTNEIAFDVHSGDGPQGDPLYTETYERRHFEGDGFGEGLDCFSSKADDSTEQRELARWSVSQASSVLEKEESD